MTSPYHCKQRRFLHVNMNHVPLVLASKRAKKRSNMEVFAVPERDLKPKVRCGYPDIMFRQLRKRSVDRQLENLTIGKLLV
jgi:hypothetical protein